MAFREVIEAILRVKDANRFKAGMDKASRSVRKLGHDEEEAAAQTELLKDILEHLSRQSMETMVALRALGSSVDNVGDQMAQTAAKTVAANAVMKKSGSNAVFLGKSWAFWKDRLSLTRSEVMTTALTIGTYLSPAIIALGSSFAFAAIGGGAVAAGGMATFIFGLVTMMALFKPVTDGIKKIMKAQDQLTLATAQYGATSKEASRANAHLGGIIKTQGGAPVLAAVTAIRDLRKEWEKLTTPGKADLLGSLTEGIGHLRNLLPTLSTAANGMAQGLRAALHDAFGILDSPDLRETLRTMAITFDRAIGPGARGFAKAILVIGRIIRAVSPHIITWADAWERTMSSWERGTRDSTKLSKFFNKAVEHFKAWWGLAKELGRTLKIVFGSTNDEGLKIVGWLTDVVKKFNDWLQKMSDTGKIDKWFKKWEDSISTAFWIFTHPVQAFNKYMPDFLAAIDRWLPVIMTHIGNTFASAAPAMADTFIHAWLDAGGWAKFLTAAILLKKMGFFGYMGRKLGTTFVEPFAKKFVAGFAATFLGISTGEGALAASVGKAGTTLGTKFGLAFQIAAVGAIGLVGEGLRQKLEKTEREKLPGGNQLADAADFLTKNIPLPGFKEGAAVATSFYDYLFGKKKPHGGALGGVIPPGGSAFVGEMGPEIATAGPRGTMIRPLGGNSRHTLESNLNIPNLEDRLNITVYSNIQIDRREIARAVSDQTAYDRARRGGHKAETP